MKIKASLKSVSYVTIGLILGKILGFIKHITVTRYLGMTQHADAFFVVNTISEMAVNIMIAGMLTGAIVPFASQILMQDGKQRFSEFIRSTFLALGSILILLALILFIFAHPIARLIASGYTDEQLIVVSTMLKIFTPGLIFIGLAAVLQGTMHTMEKFFVPAFGLAVANGTVIGFTILFYQRLGMYTPMYGTAAGFLLWFLMQVPFTWKYLCLRGSFNRSLVRRLLHLTFPAIIVILFANIVLLIEKSVATNYSEGSVTQLNLAFRLVSIFSAVLILPLSTVLLPKLSKNYGSNNHDRLYELIKKGLQYAVLAIFPFLAGIILNDSLVSKVFFGILHLPAEAMQHIARYLTIYSFAIAFSFINMVLQEVFYSIQKAKYLIVANVLGTAIYLGIIFAFSVHLGVRVLPVAYIAYLMVTTVFPLLVLERKIFRSESTVLNWGFLAGILLFSVLLFWLKNFLCSGGYKMLTGVFLTLGLFAGYFWIFRERLKRLLSFALREKPL